MCNSPPQMMGIILCQYCAESKTVIVIFVQNHNITTAPLQSSPPPEHNSEEPILLLQSGGRITPLGSKLITDIDIIDMEPQMCSGHQDIHQ